MAPGPDETRNSSSGHQGRAFRGGRSLVCTARCAVRGNCAEHTSGPAAAVDSEIGPIGAGAQPVGVLAVAARPRSGPRSGPSPGHPPDLVVDQRFRRVGRGLRVAGLSARPTKCPGPRRGAALGFARSSPTTPDGRTLGDEATQPHRPPWQAVTSSIGPARTAVGVTVRAVGRGGHAGSRPYRTQRHH
jgi:hypothetical protein